MVVVIDRRMLLGGGRWLRFYCSNPFMKNQNDKVFNFKRENRKDVNDTSLTKDNA